MTLTLPLIAIAWLYVVLMVALVEWLGPGGSALGALFTLFGWGVLPLGLVLYILSTPARRHARLRREHVAASAQPDGSGHASGDAVTPERKES